MIWRSRSRMRREQAEVVLVEEAEAFLTGRYEAAVTRGASGVPVWARVNWLAHAPPSDLTALTLDGRLEPTPRGSWAWAVHELTLEIVELAQGNRSLIERLQRECMIPLEMALLDPHLWSALPAEVVLLALNRLRSHPVARASPGGSAPGPTGDP